MRLADIVKLNDEELPRIMSLNNVSHKDESSSAEWLIRTHDLNLVSITRGGRGSLLVRATESSEHPGFRVRVIVFCFFLLQTIIPTAFSSHIYYPYLIGESLFGASFLERSFFSQSLALQMTTEVASRYYFLDVRSCRRTSVLQPHQGEIPFKSWRMIGREGWR